MKKGLIILGIAAGCLGFSSILGAATKDKITMEEARAIALNKVPGGTVTDIELDYKLGNPVYGVEIYLEGYDYEIKLDGVTGTGISVKKELSHEEGITGSQMEKVMITEEQAVKIALNEVPGASVAEIELEQKKNTAVYEIELVKDYTEYDLKIDAVTGEVLQCHIDD